MNTKVIAAELKYFKCLCVYMENRQELKKHGIDYLFPCLIDKKTEELKVLTYQTIDQTIENMGDQERLIIQEKYLANTLVTDKEIYFNIGHHKNKYYQIKKSALNKLAEALNTI